MERKQKITLILVAVFVIGLVALAAFALSPGKSTQHSDEDDDFTSSIIIFIPIWTAVFVPIFARSNKEPTPEQKRRLRILVVIGVAALLAGIAAFVMLL